LGLAPQPKGGAICTEDHERYKDGSKANEDGFLQEASTLRRHPTPLVANRHQELKE
jgi:hypothetical protein